MNVVLNTLSKEQKRLLVARAIPITSFLEQGRKMYSCPFHEDSTPSGKLYVDDGIERLFCFGCQRQWTSYDYIKRILEKDPWQHLLVTVKEPELVILARQVKAMAPYKPIDFTILTKRYEETGNLTEYVEAVYKAIPA